MPDFERLTSNLEQHLASTAEEAAYVRGKHAGLSEARTQVVKVAVIVALVVALGAAYIA